MSSKAASQPVVYPQNPCLTILVHALLLVTGFSLIFIVGWGGSVTALGQLFRMYKRVVAQLGGVIVIIFGLATLEIIRIHWFYADTRAISWCACNLRWFGADGHFLRRRRESLYRRDSGYYPNNGIEPAN